MAKSNRNIVNKFMALSIFSRLTIIIAGVFIVVVAFAAAGGFSLGKVLYEIGAVPPPEGLPGPEEFGMTKKELVENIEKVEALIAQCMGDAGFEYVAADYKTVRRGMKADKSLPGLSEKGYIARHGFGIATMYTGRPPQLDKDTTPGKIGLGEQNVRIFQNLSPADQVAYTHTLLGENVDMTFAVAIEIEDFSATGGCTRQAIEKVFKPDQMQATYVNPLDALIYRDPRVVEALVKFEQCMAEAGFNYNHPDDVEKDLRKRLHLITGGLPLDKLSPEAVAAFKELEAEERAVSVATYDCEERFVDPAEEKVERELFARILK